MPAPAPPRSAVRNRRDRAWAARVAGAQLRRQPLPRCLALPGPAGSARKPGRLEAHRRPRRRTGHDLRRLDPERADTTHRADTRWSARPDALPHRGRRPATRPVRSAANVHAGTPAARVRRARLVLRRAACTCAARAVTGARLPCARLALAAPGAARVPRERAPGRRRLDRRSDGDGARALRPHRRRPPLPPRPCGDRGVPRDGPPADLGAPACAARRLPARRSRLRAARRSHPGASRNRTG